MAGCYVEVAAEIAGIGRSTSTSLARCGGCGESYWGRTNQQGKGRWKYAQILHAPRGCKAGVRSRNEDRLSEQFGAWLATWTLPADARSRIAQYVGSGHADTGTEVRRRQLGGELDRLQKLYRWGDMGEDDYLRERRRVTRAIEALGPSEKPYEVDADALRLAATIGEAWRHAGPETRKAFLDEWFSELRLHPDGRMELVAREAVREIVFAALPTKSGMVGSTGVEASEPHPSPDHANGTRGVEYVLSRSAVLG